MERDFGEYICGAHTTFQGHGSFFSEHKLILFYICTKFCETIYNGFKLSDRTSFYTKNTKAHDSIKNVGG